MCGRPMEEEGAMATTSEQFSDRDLLVHDAHAHTPVSAVSWGAILAGATAAAALSLILLILGTGLGLSSVSPWVHDGLSAKAVGISTIVWISVTQILASGLGGYIAGRLRTRWTGVHQDEVHFRDTAHGLLAWCVASLATAALLTSVIGSIIGGGIQAGTAVAQAATTTVATTAAANAGTDGANAEADGGAMNYFVDALFRTQPTAATTTTTDGAMPGPPRVQDARASAEVTRILALALYDDSLPAEDKQHAGAIVAAHTGLTQQQAEARVQGMFQRLQTRIEIAETKAQEAANKARKASAYAALWLFISLLIGAFVATLAATFGGRQRDLQSF